MHIIKTQNFTKEFLEEIFHLSKFHKEKKSIDPPLVGKLIASLFYEESTRTRLSFEAAAQRLGAGILSSVGARKFSSAAKGETLEDTIRVVCKCCDCIVLRYHEEGGAQRAAHVSSVPIINAGDGSGQHPTQSLLDLFTIKDELGQIDGINVALVGDLKHGRTVHSLAYLLGKFDNVKLHLCSPPNLCMPDDILDYLRRHNIAFTFGSEIEDIVEYVDVLYQTRIQEERFVSKEEFESSKGKLVITRDLANRMKADAIIMHPLPRIDEIRYGVDDNHRAKYFQQAENGLYVRMALLEKILKRV